MDTKYRKLRCVVCGNQYISRAKKPECSKCGSCKCEEIDQIETTAPIELPKSKPTPKPKEKPEKKPINDIDSDVWSTE